MNETINDIVTFFKFCLLVVFLVFAGFAVIILVIWFISWLHYLLPWLQTINPYRWVALHSTKSGTRQANRLNCMSFRKEGEASG